jgi:hypothetical protein
MWNSEVRFTILSPLHSGEKKLDFRQTGESAIFFGLDILESRRFGPEFLGYNKRDRFCGLVVRVPGYRSRGAGSIPGTTR